MPTYDYQCDACSHAFEEFQSFSEEPLKKCPKCGKKKLRRLLGTGAAILFKGAGFYQTDYRSEGYKSAAKADQQTQSSGNAASANGTAKSEPAASAPAPAKTSETKSTKSTS